MWLDCGWAELLLWFRMLLGCNWVENVVGLSCCCYCGCFWVGKRLNCGCCCWILDVVELLLRMFLGYNWVVNVVGYACGRVELWWD